MVQQQQQKWLHLYTILKSEIDEYISEHPKAIQNILNFKKMSYVQTHDKVIKQLHSLKLSRPKLLTEMNKYLSQTYSLLFAPLIYPSKQFMKEAAIYFQDKQHKYNVLHGMFKDREHDRIYDYYILKTSKNVMHARYKFDQLYFVMYLRNEKEIIEILEI
jgi:hypothetical protein